MTCEGEGAARGEGAREEDRGGAEEGGIPGFGRRV